MGRYKAPRVNLERGVTRQIVRGLPYYIATIMHRGERRELKFSVGALGEERAKLCAQRQRLAWMVELGLWVPGRDVDPHGCTAEPISRVQACEDEPDVRCDFTELAQMSHRYVAA